MKYRKPADIAFVLVDDSSDPPPTLFLYRLPDGPLLALEGTGALIWSLAIEGDVDIVRAAARLTSAVALDIERDVLDFVQTLLRQRLIEIDDDD